MVEYREITAEEQEEIKRLSNEGKQLLAITDTLNERDVLDAIDSFFDELEQKALLDDTIIEQYAYELGSLFAEIIQQKYGWKWYLITKEDEEYFVVASAKRRACCAVHNYFYSILKREHSNNFVLLFNMIKNQYPKNWDFMFLT